VSGAKQLRQLLAGSVNAPLVVAGGGTPLEALGAEQASFEAFYLSGYAVAAWRHGLPDIGLLGSRDMAQALRAVTRVIDIPVICDADTGYGDEASAFATVRLLEDAGAAAIQLEDQAWPKKCGHMKDKRVIDRDEAIRKVAAAVAARQNPDTVIIARTDAIAPVGIDEALLRAKRFVAEGADVIFIDAPQSMEHLERIGQEITVPLLVNMSEGGRTPERSAAEYHRMGFNIALFPASSLLAAAPVIEHLMTQLAATGDTRPLRDQMWGLDELNALVKLDTYNQLGS
jgi:2-methylisocitrate lyase-like PEP mutase family enzyme